MTVQFYVILSQMPYICTQLYAIIKLTKATLVHIPGHFFSDQNLKTLQWYGLKNDTLTISYTNFLSFVEHRITDNNNLALFLIQSDIYIFKNEDLNEYTSLLKRNIFYIPHGFDEESFFHEGRVYLPTEEQKAINQLSNPFLTDLGKKLTPWFEETYKIDKNKPTLIFFDTGGASFFLSGCIPNENAIDNVNELIKLKSKFNIVVRFYPMAVKERLPKNFTEHFVFDITPFPLETLWDMADIILTSRITSSGIQALLTNKPMLIIEYDHSFRTNEPFSLFPPGTDPYITQHVLESNRGNMASTHEACIWWETSKDESLSEAVLRTYNLPVSNDMKTAREKYCNIFYGTFNPNAPELVIDLATNYVSLSN